MVAFDLTSGIGIIALIFLALLFLLWIGSLFLLVGDSLSLGAKILWFVFLTCLAPIAIPLYFINRSRRTGATAPAG